MATSNVTKVFTFPASASLHTVFGYGELTSGVHTFYPGDIPGLILWLDATQISGIASGTSLSAWTDSSSSFANATRSFVTQQPSLITGAQNGNSIVSFPAGGHAFLVSSTSFAQPFTLAAAFVSNTTTGAQAVVMAPGGSDGLYATAGANYTFFAGSTVTGSAYTSGAWISAVAIVNGSATTLSISGTTVSGDAGATNGPTIQVGATGANSQLLNGAIGEIMVYNRAVKESERVALTAYLKTKWATL